MQKRTLILGDYNTAAHGWTLAAWSFPEPDPVENLVQVPGRICGPLDLSTALTGGEPRYGPRDFKATLECSEGTRENRLWIVSEMVNQLHGQRVKIVLPDHPYHYAVGRLTVREKYNNQAHAAVEVAGVCEPWLYAETETDVPLDASTEEQTRAVNNFGVMPVVPLVTVSGDEAAFHLAYNGNSWTLSAGEYKLPALRLTPGRHKITFSGTGSAVLTYRGAVLR